MQLSNKLHPSCRLKNHNLPNQTKPLKYLEPNISKPPFDISLKLIAPFFNQFITEKPLELHKIIENYKNKKISLQELEYEIKISEKINTALRNNSESKSNYFHDSITKLIIALAVACLLILTLFIFFITKMYQYHQIIKRISKENTHMNLDPLQPYDNLETNDTGLFETSFERSISTQTAIFLGKTPFESNIFV